jgi:hypothetical protein
MFRIFFRRNLSGLERLAASGLAKATTPDQLIVAHILHEYAKDPSRWKTTGEIPDDLSERKSDDGYDTPEGWRHGDKTTWYRTRRSRFQMTDDNTVVRVIPCIRNRDGDGLKPWFVRYSIEVSHTASRDILPVLLAPEASIELLASVNRLIAQVKKAEAIAAKAKLEMEENEKKWNFAEHLLGMKRTPDGALVPIQPESEPCPS